MIGSYYYLLKDLFRLLKHCLLQFFMEYFYCIFRRKITGFMASHSICDYQKIRERSHRFICYIYKVLIDFSFSTHIGHCIYFHLVLLFRGFITSS